MKEKEFEYLDELLKNKNWAELTQNERAYVQETIGGEEAYNRYAELLIQSGLGAAKPVSKQVNKQLMAHFKSRNRSAVYSILNYRLPAYAYFALAAVFLLVVWQVSLVENVKVVTQEVFLPGKTDTVLVQLPPDTIVIERIIKEKVPVYMAKKSEVKQDGVSTPVMEGSSLADDVGLTDFLVSSR